jgi:hypothetical protein
MRLQAKELGIKGVSRMTKSELAEALSKSHAENSGKRVRGPRAKSGIIAPMIAGGMAYDAVRSPSEAGDGSATPGGSLGEGLAAGAGAAGMTAAGGYGLSKLAQALSPVANSAMAGTGMALGPMSAADMTDEFASPESRNWAARNFPSALRVGAVEDAYQMAQVPTPGARDDASMMARDQAALEERMPMASASALELPQEPAPEAASPYPPQITGRLQYMLRNGANPQQVASFLNQAIR